ncbi:MAG TPA: efflux RND transporter periplasmic adaptor subunit [Gemmatimonadales bacterium]|nr:efflux RND transporter periplasmic adaptor subunit [Gemmatimonadales bacterium]
MTKQRIAGGVVVVAIVATITAIVLLSGGGTAGRITASGTVEATETDLGFQVPGRIDSITVHEGDRVRAGDTLAWLDRSELRAHEAAALAQERAARARLIELEHGSRPQEIAQGRAAVDAATQQQAEAEKNLERATTLFAGGAISQAQLDRAQTARDVAAAQTTSAKEQLALLEQGPRTETIAAQRDMAHQAAAAVQQAHAVLRNAVIVAPVNGVVTVRHREPGETVAAGQPVVTVINPNDRWVRIYVREDQVGRLALGQDATITADAYPGRTYAGRVIYISNAAEFTPRSVQTTAERVKLVYRVKVQIVRDSTEDLKPGLPADIVLGGGR